MKQKLFTFFIVILLFLSQGANHLYSQHSVTLKSSFLSFTLTYPYDWHCESEHGLSKNIQAFLIPQTFLMDISPATIYVRVVPRTSASLSLQKFMENDFHQVKKQRPTLQYGTDYTLTTTDQKKAYIRTYFEEPQSLYDAIGYISEKKAFVIIILQATSQKAYLRALPTFRNLITSYHLEIPQKKETPPKPLQKKKTKPKKKKVKQKIPPKKQSQDIKY